MSDSDADAPYGTPLWVLQTADGIYFRELPDGDSPAAWLWAYGIRTTLVLAEAHQFDSMTDAQTIQQLASERHRLVFTIIPYTGA